MPGRSQFPTPQAVVLFGPQGIGKTSLGCQFPEPYVLHDPKELGVYTLQKYNRIPKLNIEPQKFSSFTEFMRLLEDPPKECRSLVIDGLFGLEDVMVEYKVDEDYQSNFEKFNDYKRGYDALAAQEVSQVIDILQNTYLENDINVVLLSQVNLNKIENPYGPDYRQYGPNLDSRIWEPFKIWADAVLFYFMEAVSRKENPDNKRELKGKVAKEKSVMARALHTEFNNHHEAKNRMGLPEVIEGENATEIYNNYREAVIKSFKGEQ